jgi:hypothetical protein
MRMNSDVIWFRLHRDRDYHIREPFAGEQQAAWRILGDHELSRRRIIIWRVPKNNPGRHVIPDGLMRVPFLAFADESIEDDDKTLKRIMDGIMQSASEQTAVRGIIRTGGGAVGVS